MRKWSIETLSLVGVGIVLTLLTMLAALVWHDTALSKRAGLQVDHLHERVSWLEQVRAELYRTESEQHHYLNHPNQANLARRDARLALLDQRLAEGSWLATDLPESHAQLLRLKNYIHRQLALQQPGSTYADHQSALHLSANAYLEQANGMIEHIIDNEREGLSHLKYNENKQGRQLRYNLAALLLSLALARAYFLLKIRNVTISRKAAHQLLQMSETRYRQIVDTAHEGIWLTDANGRLLLANRRMGDILGMPAADLPGRLASDFFDAATLLRVSPLQRQVALSPMRDLEYRRQDGTLAWVIIGGRLLYDEHGAISGELVMATDITERKRTEQALAIAHAELENRIGLRTAELLDANNHLRAEIEVRKHTEQALAQSEERLQEIISMMPLALFLKDADSNIVLMNEACEQQWGVKFSEISGKRELLHFPVEQVQIFWADDRTAFAGRRLLVREELIWNKQLQENRLVQTYKKPIYDKSGAPLMLIAMGIDITDRKRNEEALQQSVIQLRELSAHQESIKEDERRRIARDIHDDLGQNLMALKIDVSMLHVRTTDSHPRLNRQVQRALDTIDGTIKSVRTIINDLHPSTLELGLSPAIEWLLRQMEQRSTLRCHLVILDDSASASLDQRLTLAIFRVVQESLSNIMRHAHASKVDVSLNINSSNIAIVIADNGIGMQPDDHRKAASYGLKSIRERINAFGGELVIDSRQGDGTILSILLPVFQQQPH